jgi:hypothetical protein
MKYTGLASTIISAARAFSKTACASSLREQYFTRRLFGQAEIAMNTILNLQAGEMNNFTFNIFCRQGFNCMIQKSFHIALFYRAAGNA